MLTYTSFDLACVSVHSLTQTEAARAQATRDAVAYNAALRWTGLRFNDSTVNMAMKFPNISDPTVG